MKIFKAFSEVRFLSGMDSWSEAEEESDESSKSIFRSPEVVAIKGKVGWKLERDGFELREDLKGALAIILLPDAVDAIAVHAQSYTWIVNLVSRFSRVL